MRSVASRAFQIDNAPALVSYLPTTMEEFAATLDSLSDASRAMGAALDGLDEIVERVQSHLEAGKPLAGAYTETGWGEDRSHVFAAISGLQHALARARTEYFRALVDGEGMTITEVARLVGQPRQLVKRSYDERGKRAAD